MDSFPIGAAIVVGAAVVVGGGVTIASNLHEEHITCTITNKESISKENGHEYRVFTEECGVLTAGDNLWRGHFNSADVYGALDIGSEYDITTTGWRVPFLSWMPNIIEATPAN